MVCKVFVFGGCVSRDIFNVDHEGYFKIIDYYARSSMGSIAGAPYQNDVALDRISSDFRRRMVSRDFSKEILQAERDIAQSDIILIDLLVERLNLVELPGGEVITHSSELVESGLLSELEASGYRTISPYSDERRALWLEGAEKFFSWLEKNGKISAVVVNKIYWASEFEHGVTEKFPATIKTIEKANDELDWMYCQLKKWLLPSQFMTFSDDVFVADSQHRWGVAPYHYIPSYYTLALEKIINYHGSRSFVSERERKADEESIDCTRFKTAERVNFVVSSELVNNKLRVIAELAINGRRAANVTYAFYLLIDGERKDVHWYGPLNETVFDVSDITDLIEVVAFSKDMFGDKLIQKVKV